MVEQGGRHFRIFGMDCAEEVAVLKRELGPLVGGEQRLAFDLLRGRMTLSAEAADIESQQIVNAVAKTGLRAEPWRSGAANSAAAGPWQRWGRVALTGASGLAIVAAVALQAWISGGLSSLFHAGSIGVPLFARFVYGLAIVAGAWFVAPKAWYAARRLRPDMNLLMIVAVCGAVLIGEWLEAATVAFLFSLSLLLESWSVGRARRAVAALMDLAPPTVRLRGADGQETHVAPEDVTVGSVFSVKPGERIPLDGKIVEGDSAVNQAPITGESQPVAKQPGADVFAGTINGGGALLVRSTKPSGETTLANIIRLVGEAHSRKAPSEQWVEKFARYYTPIVMILAVAVLLLPPVLFAGSWEFWFYNALVLLVIACPCALVISTPVSIVAALAAAARQGILVKGGVFIEMPAGLQAIAFDKTGTLTVGTPSVIEVVPLYGHDERELVQRALALERQSEHPLARAIVRHAEQRGIEAAPADDFQVIPGKGAQGHFDGRLFWLGSHRFLEERGQETTEIHDRLELMSSAGHSVVVIGNDEHVCGLIALADTIRESARDALHNLQLLGVQHLVMLTGDHATTAETMAQQIGLTDYRSELLPEDKITAIEELVADFGNVAMVGDGVNDAPALARASLGIAMGAAGSDAAIETADIALMTDDLSRLPWLIRHSRRTLAVIQQNIWFSLAIKLFFVLLTLVGKATLWAAIAADMGTSLLVVFNGLRLLKTRPAYNTQHTENTQPNQHPPNQS